MSTSLVADLKFSHEDGQGSYSTHRHRQTTYSSRTTAILVRAFSEYLVTYQDHRPKVKVDHRSKKTYRILKMYLSAKNKLLGQGFQSRNIVLQTGTVPVCNTILWTFATHTDRCDRPHIYYNAFAGREYGSNFSKCPCVPCYCAVYLITVNHVVSMKRFNHSACHKRAVIYQAGMPALYQHAHARVTGCDLVRLVQIIRCVTAELGRTAVDEINRTKLSVCIRFILNVVVPYWRCSATRSPRRLSEALSMTNPTIE